MGKSWREHEDLDVGLCRFQLDVALGWLRDWDFRVGSNNVWARRSADEPWALDLTVGAGDDERWVYRRDPGLTRPWAQAALTSADGMPFLAPELQLLFKSKEVRPKDQIDAEVVIPALDETQRLFLSRELPADHPWHEIL